MKLLDPNFVSRDEFQGLASMQLAALFLDSRYDILFSSSTSNRNCLLFILNKESSNANPFKIS